MAGFLEMLIAHQKKNKQRSSNLEFFKACMAAGALTVLADGELVRREQATMNTLLKTIGELKLFQRGHGQELFAGYLKRMKDDPERGRADALAAVAEAKGNAEWEGIILMLAATLIESDGRLEESEAATLDKIAGILDLDPAAAKAIKIDISDEVYSL